MKKILSVVLTLVMVLSTFAMIVPTASAAEVTDATAAGGMTTVVNKDFTDETFQLDNELLSDDELAAVAFGEGNVDAGTNFAIDTETNGGGLLWTLPSSNGYIKLVEGVDVANGAEIIFEYTSLADAGRFFGPAGEGYVGLGSANTWLATAYSGQAGRVGVRTNFAVAGGSAWRVVNGPNAALGTKQRARVVVSYAEGVTMYVSTWDGFEWSEETMTGAFKNYKDSALASWQANAAELIEDAITLQAQGGGGAAWVIHKVNVKIAAATQEQTHMQIDNATYTQDFNSVSADFLTPEDLFASMGFTDASMFTVPDGAVLEIVDGALSVDLTESSNRFSWTLAKNIGVKTEGYVAEMDYTFSPRTKNDARWLTFSNTEASAAGGDKGRLYAAVYSPSYANGTAVAGNGARIGYRDSSSAGWQIASAAAGEALNSENIKYRMRTTVSADGVKLEVAKYTDGVLGAYAELGSHALDSYVYTDVVCIHIQNGNNVIIDNISVSYKTAEEIYDTEHDTAVVGYQYDAEAAQMRLIGAIDTDVMAKATKVGFRVEINGVAKEIYCDYVYESVDETPAADLFEGAEYVYALHIEGMPATATTVKVTPIAVYGSTTVYGNGTIFTLN